VRQANRARGNELATLQRHRRLLWAKNNADLTVIRRGLVYTRAGVLDMTRRRVHRQPQVEQIVGRIGGASTW
jgi:hypothetical protein